MNTAAMFPGRYLRAADVTSPAVLTVAKVETTSLNGTQKLLCYFEEREQPLIVNATNWRTLTTLSGSSDSDDWLGMRVLLSVARVPFQGGLVDALRLSAPPARTGKARPRREPDPDPDPADSSPDDAPF